MYVYITSSAAVNKKKTYMPFNAIKNKKSNQK